MTTFREMYNRIKEFNPLDEVVTILQGHEKDLTDIQKSQWEHGLRSDGTPIGQYALDFYAFMKANMNPLAGFGFMDLMLTRKTINSLKVSVTKKEVKYKLQSDKHELVKKYGEDILGTTKENKESLSENIVMPELIKAFKEKTGCI